MTQGNSQPGSAVVPRAVVFRLERSDLTAWEGRPRELTWRQKAALIGSLIVVGMVVGWLVELSGDVIVEHARWLPQSWRGVVSAGLLLLVWFGVWTAILTIATHRRIAARRLPGTDTVVEMQPDGLTLTEDGRCRQLAWLQFLGASLTSSHLFLPMADDDRVILPLRAFADIPDMAAFALYAKTQIDQAHDTLEPAADA